MSINDVNTVQKDNFIGGYRNGVLAFLQAFDTLQNLRREYDALSYSGGLADEDFTGPNTGLTASDFKQAVSTVQSIGDLLATGHATNLYKVKA